ncbi:MAG: hypothetical protein DRN92_01770 [Thermoproteota archaeon]|nr:MAG: hypothetical protein DRN92_01770 [Candidatus Korarchaeota archaeon]
MSKATTLVMIVILLSSTVVSVNSQEKTRNPFAVGFQFDKAYYEPNSTGNVKIWILSWVEVPIFIDAVFLHFDWMEENQSISLLGLNASVSQYEPTIVGTLNFTIPDVEPGWHGYVALVYYSTKVGGRWVRGFVRSPDPKDEREFGHDMYLLSVGYSIGQGPPMLYWDVYNYTIEVRRGDFFEVWVDLGNVGGYYTPSIHALLINDLDEVVGGIVPVNIYSGIKEPYPLLFVSYGVPSGIRARLFWKIPENYSLGHHNITLVIASGQVPQESKILNFTVLKSYSEEAREKLDVIDRFLNEVRGLVNLSKKIGIKIDEPNLLPIRDEYEQGMAALLTGHDESALEHAEKGIQLANSVKEQMEPLFEEVKEDVSSMKTSEDMEIKEHIDKAITALEKANKSDNPADWAANMTIALRELIQAKNLVDRWKSNYLVVLILLAGLIVLSLLILRKKR